MPRSSWPQGTGANSQLRAYDRISGTDTASLVTRARSRIGGDVRARGLIAQIPSKEFNPPVAGHTRLASGNVALTATSWSLSVRSCPEGPTWLDREIRVGAPARRADGSGRRTAGRWVCAIPVSVVRSSGLRVAGRDSRERGPGRPWNVPRGTDDPRGPNRPGAGGFARRSTGRGSWGLSLFRFGSSSRDARVRIGHLPGRYPPSSVGLRTRQVTIVVGLQLGRDATAATRRPAWRSSRARQPFWPVVRWRSGRDAGSWRAWRGAGEVAWPRTWTGTGRTGRCSSRRRIQPPD
jgi:hypothetical protein